MLRHMAFALFLQFRQIARPTGAATAIALCTLLAACATQPVAQHDANGAYPISDGIKATVVGTPPAWRAELPNDLPIEMRELAPLVKRQVPSVLEYAVPLEYAFVAQDQAAPLAFIITGTGATAAGSKCQILMRTLYAVGYNVACLPSPTSVNFMVGAAPHPVPGYMPADVTALYALMQAVQHDVAKETIITGYVLAGYSLGGTQAAFVAHYDERHDVFDFDKTLLINPAVSVWASVQRMDALIKNNLAGGISGVPALLASLLSDLRHPFTGNRPARFNRQMLFRATLAREANHRQLAAVVGLVFRLALANMAFAADVLTTSGKIVPPNAHLGIGTSLDPYLRASFNMTFVDYIDELLLPYWNRGARQLNRQQLITSANLHSIDDWLAHNPDIVVLTNADDPILSPDDIAFLRKTFGDRATIRPDGGHMGNLRTRAVVNQVQRFFSP